MHTRIFCMHFVTRERRERIESRVERTDARSRRPRQPSRASERRDGEIAKEICLMFLSRTNPRLYTGVLQRGLREDLLAHQWKRQARGVPVPPRQVATKRFRRQSGMAPSTSVIPIYKFHYLLNIKIPPSIENIHVL